jgi:antitoxin component YwqK of YwqJK toxin-antitoxin module
MVGASPGLIRLAIVVALAAASHGTVAATAAYVVTGNCRDGQPHGAYELRSPDGTLRVAGAFTRGKRTGSFLYWSSAGVRIAHLPYDDDMLSGTVALWYSEGGAKSEPKSKLEAVYSHGRRAGSVRSWYPNGRPRAEFRYEQGVLADARAWSVKGGKMTDADARAMAARDVVTDDQFYNALEAIVRDNPPPCDANGRRT